MRVNPHLKVFAASGYCDLATPFFATEHDLNHLGIGPELKKNLSVNSYPSGHMMYLNMESLISLRKDLVKFYSEATKNK
jgi:carboxypeptidase C (cathepsin A)